MPRTRRDRATPSDDESAVCVDDDKGIDNAASFSSQQVAAMMTAMQQSQTEAFERLLEKVMSQHPSSPVSNSTSTASQAFGSGTFTHCTARFGGDADESVDAFIDAIQSYKDCANVSEENALRGLSMVLTNNAAIWYQGIKKEIHTWGEVIDLLINTYGDKRPPHRIYKELFEQEQGNKNTDIFVSKCRALLSKIPAGDISEKAQVDMVYGLLGARIRKRLRREDFNDFSGMLRLARSIEIEDFETDTQSSQPGVSSTVRSAKSAGAGGAGQLPPPPRRSTALATPSALSAAPSSSVSTRAMPSQRSIHVINDSLCSNQNVAKPKCVYCKQYGHLRENCYKLNKCSVNVKDKSLYCYGCGAKGVMRSQCSKCNNLSFSSIAMDSSHLVRNCNMPTTSLNNVPSHDIAHSNDNNRNSAYLSNNKYIHHMRSNSNHKTLSQPCDRLNNNFLCLCRPRLINNYSCYSDTNLSCSEDSVHDQLISNNMFGSYDRVNTPNIDRYVCDLPGRVNVPIITGSNNHSVDRVNTPIIDSYVCDLPDRVDVPINVYSNDHAADRVNSPIIVPTYRLCCSNVDQCNTPTEVSSLPADTATTTTVPGASATPTVLASTPRVLQTTTAQSTHLRPVLSIQILGLRGMALIDTAARCSIAGHSLYKIFVEKGLTFSSKQVNVKLADGVVQLRDVLVARVDVNISVDKGVRVDFVIFPEADNNDTLLGIDFLNAAGMVIDFSASSWRFSGCTQTYPLEYEGETISQRKPLSVASMTLRADEGLMLTGDQHQQLIDLLQQHEDVFRPGGEATSFAEHHIDTGNHPPIAAPPYRLTPAKRAAMEAEINKMLAEGVIEECESAWAAPALLVPKKDGTYRFCVDYRRLNAITKSDTYPLPVIEDLLHATKREGYISTIDLRSGYWQVSVSPADRDKTAFVSPFGTYRFIRMPFGLKNAPATFQRLMDRFRSGSAMKDITLLVYLDDLLVLSEGDFQKHLKDLQAVFNRLRVFGLRANRSKCHFACNQVKYLGHLITPKGIMPDETKVQAIQQMNEPSNLKHLKSFLQTCSWFRKFVPGFSEIAQPLTKLTRKNEAWVWTEDQRQAFNELKKRLTTAPVLVQADYSKPFIIHTDASNYALGAVLLQGEGKDLHPIEYSSRLLTSAECKYSTTEREALAVVWALEKYRPYIEGHSVILRSDHQPLRWLLTLKSPSGRLMRWALKLQAFDVQYEYTPGKVNVIADALSRPTCNEVSQESCGVCSVIIDTPRKSAATLRSAQLDDPEVCKIIKDLENTLDPMSSLRWLERGYLMDQGVLYRHSPDSESEEPQLVIPASMLQDVMAEFHNAPTAGHQGVDRTIDRIRQRYYFTGMRKYVTDYLKNCIDCQRYKFSNQKPFGLLQTPILQQRGEVLAVDLFGPLPEAETGEKWVFLVEDTATRWVELYPIKEAHAEVCAKILIEEYFLRYGFPRRIVSDNGVQFISAVMQQCMFLFGIKQNLIPLYHPEANPAERKNRDLKVQLAMLVKNDHRSWPRFLPQVRFALNTATCSTTGLTPSYMMYGREMRTPFDAQHDLRVILDKETYVPQVTPYLSKFIDSLEEIRDRVERQQDLKKEYADASRRPSPLFQVGDQVLLSTHSLSNTAKGLTRKFMPQRDGPYIIKRVVSPTTYELVDSQGQFLGRFHVSDLNALICNRAEPIEPVQPRRPRGRPPKTKRKACF